MLTLIARGYKIMLSRQRGIFLPLAGNARQRHPPHHAPRLCGKPVLLVSPREAAAVARHLRP